MKETFRDQFKDFVESQRIHFDDLSEVARSKQMARFFAERILRPLYPTSIPEDSEEFEACVIDGKDDSGIDLLVIDDQSVIVVQAKYAGGKKQSRKAPEDKADFDRFLLTLKRMVEGPNAHAMNAKLREALMEVDFENASFQLFYITLRQVQDDLRELAEHGIQPVAGFADLHERTSVELLDEEGLNIRLRDALSATEGPGDVSIQFTESEHEQPWISFVDGREHTYLGRVTGSELAAMFTRYKSRLFGLNIRNYIGDNITNRTIRKTALEESDKFFFYNNGVTILASGVEVDTTKPRTLRCRSFNIINGAQTVRSLNKAHADKPQALRNVNVLVRIIEYPAKRSQLDQAFLDNVTRFNNTQNAVKISDFRSNDPVQHDLRIKFDKLPARKGRKFLYRNKRSVEGQSKIVVGMEDFSKTLYAFEFGPADAFGGTRHLFDSSKTGGYAALYGSEGEVIPALSDDTFQRYLGIWFCCEYTRDLLAAESKNEPHQALERRWLVYYAMGESIRTFYSHLNRPYPDALRKLASPSWYEDSETKAPKSVVRKYFPIAAYSLKNAYDAASKSPEFTHRNWFRDKDTLTAIHYEIDKLWPMFKAESDRYVF